MTVLVAVSSRHGSTAEVAQAIGQTLRARGLQAEVHSVDDVSSIDGYSAVVIGSAVYHGHWLPSAVTFVERHATELGTKPVWLFSSGPVGDPALLRAPEEAKTMLELIHAREHRVFAGRIDGDDLDEAERLHTAMTPGHEGDYRDWGAVRTWAGWIAQSVARNDQLA